MRIDSTALTVGEDGALSLTDDRVVAYADIAWLGRPGPAPALVLAAADDQRILAALGELVAAVVARTGRGPVSVVGHGAVATALRAVTAASPDGPAPTTIDTTGDDAQLAGLLGELAPGGMLVAAAPPRAAMVELDVYDLLHVPSRTLVAIPVPDGGGAPPLDAIVTSVADRAVPPVDAALVRVAAA